MQKTLKIKGMHCSSCEMLLKDVIEELGAHVKKIDHKTGEASIEYDEKKIPLEIIKGAIKKEGYAV